MEEEITQETGGKHCCVPSGMCILCCVSRLCVSVHTVNSVHPCMSVRDFVRLGVCLIA